MIWGTAAMAVISGLDYTGRGVRFLLRDRNV
jgi:hypothetical protein